MDAASRRAAALRKGQHQEDGRPGSLAATAGVLAHPPVVPALVHWSDEEKGLSIHQK